MSDYQIRLLDQTGALIQVVPTAADDEQAARDKAILLAERFGAAGYVVRPEMGSRA